MTLLRCSSLAAVFGLVVSMAAARQDDPVNTDCPVSGRKARSNITVEYKGKKVALCCNNCVKKWNADPDKWAASVDFGEETAKADDKAELGKVVPNFKLKTVDGEKEVDLSSFRKSKDNEGKIVVVHFWSYKCPSGKRVLADVGELAKLCKEKGVEFLGVCAYGESAKDLDKYRTDNKIDYTLLHDEKYAATKILGAQVVTTSCIIGQDGILLYTGGFKGRRDYPLKDALDEVLAGKEVSKKETRASG